jgi:hypothetical protein
MTAAPTRVRELPRERVLEFAETLPTGQREAVIDLAGKWKHGWIPLDAIAAAIKAKQMKGDGIRRPGANAGAVRPRPAGKSRLDARGAAQRAAVVNGARAKGRPAQPGRRTAAPGAPASPRTELQTHAAEAVRLKAPELRDRAAKGDRVAAAELERRAAKRTAKAPAAKGAEQALHDRYAAARTPQEKELAASNLAEHYRAAGKATPARNWQRTAEKHAPGEPAGSSTPEHIAKMTPEQMRAELAPSKAPHTAAVAGVGDGAATPAGMPTISREDAMRRLAASYTHTELAAELKRAKTGSDAHKILHEEGVRRLQQAEHPDAPPREEPPAVPAAKPKAKRKPSALHEEYRRQREEQDRRFEAHAGGGVAAQDTKSQEYKDYFGVGDHSTTPQEERVTFARFLEQRRQGNEYQRRQQQAYDSGVKLGVQHAQQSDSSKHDAEYAHHEANHGQDGAEMFGSGYSDGILAGSQKAEEARKAAESAKATADYDAAHKRATNASVAAGRAGTAEAHKAAILAHADAGKAALAAGDREQAQHHIALAGQHKAAHGKAVQREAEAGDATKVNERLRAESAARGEPQTEAEHAARAHDWNIGNRVQATADGHSTAATPEDAAVVLRSRWTTPAQKEAARKLAQQRHEAVTAAARERLAGTSDEELAKLLREHPLATANMPAENKRAIAAVARERLAARGGHAFTTGDQAELNRKLEAEHPGASMTHAGQSMSDGELATADPGKLTDRDLLIARHNSAMIPARAQAIQAEINRRHAEKNAARPPAEPAHMPDAEARAIARMGTETDRSRAPGPNGEQHGDVVTLTNVGTSGERRAVYVGRDINGNPQYRGTVNGTMSTSSIPASSYDKIGPRVNKGSEIVPRNPGQSRFARPVENLKRRELTAELLTAKGPREQQLQAELTRRNTARANGSPARGLNDYGTRHDNPTRLQEAQDRGPVRLEGNQSIVLNGPNAGKVSEGRSSATAGSAAERKATVRKVGANGTDVTVEHNGTTYRRSGGGAFYTVPERGAGQMVESPTLQRRLERAHFAALEQHHAAENPSAARQFGEAANAGQRANIGEAQAQARKAAQGPPQQGEMFGGHGEHQGDMFDQPPEPAKAAPSIRVEHSGDGTVVYGTERGDTATTEALKAQGFKWSRNLGGWYLPRTWNESTRELRVRGLQARLGDKITVERGARGPSGTAAERAQAQIARANEIADQQRERAARFRAESDAQDAAARRISDHIPMGQPILVGHHSEGRHRRDLERIHSRTRKSIEAHDNAQHAEGRAQSAEARARQLGDPRAAARRLERSQAELRSVERKLNGTGKEMHGENHPATGDYAERLRARQTELKQSIEHDTGIAGDLVGGESGQARYGKHNVQPGDVVKVGGTSHIVHSTGPKNAKLMTSVGPLPYAYTQIQAHGPLEDASTDTLKKMLANSDRIASFGSSRRTFPPAVTDRIKSILRARGEG